MGVAALVITPVSSPRMTSSGALVGAFPRTQPTAGGADDGAREPTAIPRIEIAAPWVLGSSAAPRPRRTPGFVDIIGRTALPSALVDAAGKALLQLRFAGSPIAAGLSVALSKRRLARLRTSARLGTRRPRGQACAERQHDSACRHYQASLDCPQSNHSFESPASYANQPSPSTMLDRRGGCQRKDGCGTATRTRAHSQCLAATSSRAGMNAA